MKDFKIDFACPKCKQRLALVPNFNTKACANGHTYDRARAGYYNLLLGVGGGTHGDNAEMVEARRSFLSLGYYSALADRLADLVSECTGIGECVLDAGCGEGYYTDRIEHKLSELYGGSNVLAFDISKDAVRQAVKRNRDISYCVASSYDMPLPDSSVDTVYNAFSPLALDEVRRVLKKNGRFIMVYPGREHLFGLKEKIYKTPYKNEPQDAAIDGFELLKEETLTYDITLTDKESIRSLFMMTPYAYRTSKEDSDRIMSLDTITTAVEFCISVYTKS